MKNQMILSLDVYLVDLSHFHAPKGHALTQGATSEGALNCSQPWAAKHKEVT
jgi:hypothetical protein